MLIVVEGADGCGKNTVADALARMLLGERMDFPSSATVTGPMIRRYLGRGWEIRTSGVLPSTDDPKSRLLDSALAFQSLQIVNRLEEVPRMQALDNEGIDLVLARYWQSGWVYGQVDGLDAEFLEVLHQRLPVPDLNILLDLHPKVSIHRCRQREGVDEERYDGDLAQSTRITGLYQELWSQSVGTRPGEWRVVDANQDLEAVVACAGECVVSQIRMMAGV